MVKMLSELKYNWPRSGRGTEGLEILFMVQLLSQKTTITTADRTS